MISIQVCLISWVNIKDKDMVERKAFLVNPKDQHHVSQCGEDDYSSEQKEWRLLGVYKH